jgi:flagellar operon protein
MLKIAAYQNVKLPEKVQRPATMPSKASGRAGRATGDDFKTELNSVLEKSTGVQFSAHAKARLHSRGVVLSQEKLDALSQAIDKAEAKGSRESLVLSDEAAYVVSVRNRTVITAFDRDNLRDGVFTAIDSAVIL